MRGSLHPRSVLSVPAARSCSNGTLASYGPLLLHGALLDGGSLQPKSALSVPTRSLSLGTHVHEGSLCTGRHSPYPAARAPVSRDPTGLPARSFLASHSVATARSGFRGTLRNLGSLHPSRCSPGPRPAQVFRNPQNSRPRHLRPAPAPRYSLSIRLAPCDRHPLRLRLAPAQSTTFHADGSLPGTRLLSGTAARSGYSRHSARTAPLLPPVSTH